MSIKPTKHFKFRTPPAIKKAPKVSTIIGKARRKKYTDPWGGKGVGKLNRKGL